MQAADEGDTTTTVVETVAEAGERIAETAAETNSEEGCERVNPEGPREIVTDKGYHSKKVMNDLAELELGDIARSRRADPNAGAVNIGNSKPCVPIADAFVESEGKRLLRQRGEKLERWNEHLYDRGGMRRVHLRGRTNILKRLVVRAGAANLGLLMRKLFGVGTPRALFRAGLDQCFRS